MVEVVVTVAHVPASIKALTIVAYYKNKHIWTFEITFDNKNFKPKISTFYVKLEYKYQAIFFSFEHTWLLHMSHTLLLFWRPFPQAKCFFCSLNKFKNLKLTVESEAHDWPIERAATKKRSNIFEYFLMTSVNRI